LIGTPPPEYFYCPLLPILIPIDRDTARMFYFIFFAQHH
jgi:hypothetical protein